MQPYFGVVSLQTEIIIGLTHIGIKPEFKVYIVFKIKLFSLSFYLTNTVQSSNKNSM